MSTPNYPSIIKVIGFDLDQTLYPKSPEIDQEIQKYIYKKIAEHRSVSLDDAEKLFRERYQDGRGMGGSSTLRDLGIPNASEIVQEALERANIASYLVANREVLNLLMDLKKKYEHVDLITGANMENAFSKLDELEIPVDTFSHAITGEDGSKSNGDAYKKWLTIYPTFAPSEFLYIGDRPMSDYEMPRSLGIHSMLVNVTKPDEKIECPQLASVLEIRSLL